MTGVRGSTTTPPARSQCQRSHRPQPSVERFRERHAWNVPSSLSRPNVVQDPHPAGNRNCVATGFNSGNSFAPLALDSSNLRSVGSSLCS